MSDPTKTEIAILNALSDADGHLSFSVLKERVTMDADDVEEVLGQLQDKHQVEYSGRHGGYKLTAVPNHDTCAVCGEPIQRGAHYQLRIDHVVRPMHRRNNSVSTPGVQPSLPRG